MLSPLCSKALAELIGTFMVTLTMPLASIGVGSMAPVAVGFMLGAMIFTFGYISGGHFNPAVSFVAFLNHKSSLQRFIVYVIAQLIGSILASLYGVAVVGIDIPVPQGSLSTFASWQTFLCELAFSFGMMTVVLHLCFAAGHTQHDFYGFAVPFTLLSAGLCMGGVESSGLNPAVATGSQVVACFSGTCEPLLWCWIYWVGPILGGIFATLLFRALDLKDIDALGPAHRYVVY